jgi:hypothetical protein
MDREKKFIREQTDLLKSGISQFFDIDKPFIEISEPFNQHKRLYVGIEIRFKSSDNNLRTFHLTTYSFNIELTGKKEFRYENTAYRFTELDNFLHLVSKQMKMIN